MRMIVAPALLITFVGLFAAPALAAPNICIDTRKIVSSTPQGHGRAILFKMRDGTLWRNNLRGVCPGLDFDGYAWTVRNPDSSVCENEETLRVLQSGEICALGKFEKVTPAGPG